MAKRDSIGKDAVRLTVSKMTTLLIATVTSMLLARFRTFEEYGTYSQMQLVVTLFASIFMLGLPNSINYFLAKANTTNERCEFLGVYYALNILLSAAMGITLVILVPLIVAYFKNPAIKTFTYFLFLYPWASVTTSSIENVLVVYHKTRLLMVYRFLNSLCILGAVLVIQWLGLGFREYMTVNTAVYCGFSLYVYFIAYRISGGFHLSLNRKLIRKIFVFSLPIGLASVVGTLNIEIDKLLIGFMMDTKQMAIYTNASKELPVSFIAASITAVLMPQLTRMLQNGKNREAICLWGSATELSFAILCLIAFGMFTYAEDVLVLLYSEKYLPGLPVFRVYTLVLLLRCTYFGMILNAKGKTKDIFYASLASLVLNVVLNPLLYWLFGMVGPAIATFVAILVVQLWQLYRTALCTGVSFGEVFPWKRLGWITLINIMFAILFYGVKYLLPFERIMSSLGESLLLGVCWSGIYLLVVYKSIKQAWNSLNSKSEENADS